MELIRFFTDRPELYNDWRFVWNGPWERWVLFGAALAILVAIYWSHRASLRLSKRGQRLAIFALRLLGGLALWLLLAEPAVELRNIQKTKNYLPIFIDTSASMNVKDRPDGPSRIQLVERFLRENREVFEELKDDNRLRWYTFDRGIKQFNPESQKLEALGDRTDLFKIVQFLQREYSDRPLAGAILITDGVDTLYRSLSSQKGPLRQKKQSEQRRKFQRLGYLVAGFKDLGVPFHIVAPPKKSEIRDIAVSEVYGDAFAFLHNTATIEVELSGLGYSGLSVPVSLYREGKLLKTKIARFKKKREKIQLSFSFKPRKAGHFIYSIKVPLQAGEAIEENNQKFFTLKIIRDRIRVLQLTGRPSWDVRFLRRLLKKNASVDLVSFFILRTAYNIQPVPIRELALIPFPSHELFSKSIFTFDLTIFQNFNYAPYLHRFYLNNIEKFVRNGGAFLMLGGDLSFGAGGYLNTPIEKLLPVKLNIGQINTDKFKPQLTKAGYHHPITRLTANPEENKRLWRQFPPVRGVNLIGDAKPHATVLLTHPRLRTESGKPLPVLTVGRYHKGRVMAVAIDDSWRWNFEFVGNGGTPGPYYRFWNNAIRWLIRDPELERVQISSMKSSYRLGESVRFRVRVFSRDYRPLRGGKVQIEILSAPSNKLLYRKEHQLNSEGVVSGSWPPPKSGMYRIRARAQIDPYLSAQGEVIFEVRGFADEYQEIAPNERFFRTLAESTGGGVYRLDEKFELPQLKPPEVVKINRSRTVLLWNNALAFSIFFLLFALEWFLRRRWGLP